MKTRGRAGFGNVKEKMAQLVEHYREFGEPRQAAVDRDKITAAGAEIKSAYTKRAFDHRDVAAFADRIKIGFVERPLIPLDLELADLFREKSHL